MKESDYIKSGELVYSAFVKYKEALNGRPTDAREQATLFVKTVWLNHVNDDHATLDPSKYERA